MADYGHYLSFGIFVTPKADAGPHVIELARRADAAGLDWVSVQDHPYQPAFLDAWTLLTAIATATATIGVFPNVANLPLRPPCSPGRRRAWTSCPAAGSNSAWGPARSGMRSPRWAGPGGPPASRSTRSARRSR